MDGLIDASATQVAHAPVSLAVAGWVAAGVIGVVTAVGMRRRPGFFAGGGMTATDIRPGQRVRITGGPWAGHSGEVVQVALNGAGATVELDGERGRAIETPRLLKREEAAADG